MDEVAEVVSDLVQVGGNIWVAEYKLSDDDTIYRTCIEATEAETAHNLLDDLIERHLAAIGR